MKKFSVNPKHNLLIISIFLIGCSSAIGPQLEIDQTLLDPEDSPIEPLYSDPSFGELEAPSIVELPDWYVSTEGDDGNSCKSPSDACLTLQHAVDLAQYKDQIQLLAGDYVLSGEDPRAAGVTINGNWIEIHGPQSGKATLSGASGGDIFNITGNAFVDIVGVNIGNCGNPRLETAAIRLEGIAYLGFHDSVIRSDCHTGIKLEDISTSDLRRSQIFAGAFGAVHEGYRLTTADVTISGSSQAGIFSSGDYLYVFGTNVIRNHDGVYIQGEMYELVAHGYFQMEGTLREWEFAY